ncbi:ABC transporter ATP-binding protein [Chungangia koreensis]|uniref:ABC transporter ATP-binding protein n=1 Tax=Chungangia koreensis TaxID=752657 RepID=A0ABV8X0B1_9LACT
MTEPVIQFNQFSFQYHSQSKPTLMDINLTIQKGEKVCIVGPSGSGKSTLVHCLNGLVPFAYKGEISGSLKINGKETRDLDIFSISEMVGTVLQDTDGQFIGLTVAEDIAFALENHAVPLRQMKDRVHQAADLVHITSHLNSRIHELSGGQKQRVALAGVLVNEIDVVLFDEPLANLDPASGKEAMALIDELQRTTRKTVIIVEHRLEDVLSQPVDRIILVNHGRIVADVTPEEALAGNLLNDNWIREPLYIKALKYAGIEFTEDMSLTELNKLNSPGMKEKVSAWQEKAQAFLGETVVQEPVLELQNVRFHYPEKADTIKDVSFTLHAGEMVSLIGANGAGKSTLSSLICGFEKPSGGAILFDGVDQKDESIKQRAERVGFVLQNPNHMFSKQIVFEEAAFGLIQKGMSEEEARPKVEETLKICGLYPFRNWPISALSYGQKKRLSIASILVMEPEIILLDEPTAGQDYKHTTELLGFLETLRERGIAIILITHDMHLMTEYTDRAIVLSGGHVLADEPPAHVLSNPELIREANLKESSLFELANVLGLGDPARFVDQFIQYDREVRTNGQ